MERHQYNGFDNIITRRLADKLLSELTPTQRRLYEAEMALHAPFMEVGFRGVRMDQEAARSTLKEMQEAIQRCIEKAERTAERKLSGPKAFSPAQLASFFYIDLRLQGGPSTSEKQLYRLRERKVPCQARVAPGKRGLHKDRAAEVAAQVLEARHLAKRCLPLEAKKHRGRLRGQINVGATETFRVSCSKTPLGDGTNLQNIHKEMRGLFIPDPGFTMVQGDQEQAESRAVAYLSGDPAYIEAHESGNTHITVGRVLFPDFGWSGDATEDRARAKQPYRGHLTYYDFFKRVQHGSNYGLTPRGMAQLLGIPIRICEEAQERYFDQFKGIKRWHERTRDRLVQEGVIEMCGIRRQFFGKPTDPHTLKEALAFQPQAIVAWTNHIVFHRLWRYLDGPHFQLLAHTHDGWLAQLRGAFSATWKRRIEALSQVHWPIEGRILTIPWELKQGRSWAEVS